MFENDVKMYGIQNKYLDSRTDDKFENDVKMYGIQTDCTGNGSSVRLRMM